MIGAPINLSIQSDTGNLETKKIPFNLSRGVFGTHSHTYYGAFAKYSDFKLLTNSLKSSIINVWLSPKYASFLHSKTHLHLMFFTTIGVCIISSSFDTCYEEALKLR